mmetsp:Transcript_40602/g.41286  ORF Transcript_40602/g.41286 Transcript_40602/m.41286 type:complete len:100 (-) Transcript_40602:466-765(-)
MLQLKSDKNDLASIPIFGKVNKTDDTLNEVVEAVLNMDTSNAWYMFLKKVNSTLKFKKPFFIYSKRHRHISHAGLIIDPPGLRPPTPAGNGPLLSGSIP